MRILVVGGTGTIGEAVVSALREREHEVVRAGHSGGDHRVDLADPSSIDALYAAAGPFGAVVCTAGVARFGALEELDDGTPREELATGLEEAADGLSSRLAGLTREEVPGWDDGEA